MTIEFAGALPVSALNVGLTAAVPGLTAEVTALAEDLAEFPASLVAQAQVTSHFPPDPVGYAAAIGSSLSVPELTARLSPANWVTMGADISADLTVDLGLVNAKLAIVAPLVATLGIGLETAGIAGWSYAGRAGELGARLGAATQFGFSGIGGTEDVQGLVIATESLEAWQSLAAGLAVRIQQAQVDAPSFIFEGARAGAQWNIGVRDIFARISLFLASLNSSKTEIETRMQLALGVDLPDPEVVVNAGADIFGSLGIDGIMGNLVDVQTDLDLGVSAIQARIDVLTSLIADINAQLSADGIAFWSYSGPANELGAAVESELDAGIPGGTGERTAIYSLILAGRSLSDFGNIFKVAA